MTAPPIDSRVLAGLDLLGRSGALSTQIRYSDDPEPVVWIVVVEWNLDRRGHPVRQGKPGKSSHEAAAGLTPAVAVMRLLEQAFNGGTCVHCERPSGVSDDWTNTMLLPDLICWYVYDPKLATFRRSCEGDA